MHSRILALVVFAFAAAGAGCTSFSTVRSARVQPGPSFTVQASTTSPTGDGAGWFWSFDCASNCSNQIASFDAAYSYGRGGDRPYTLGGGMNGLLFPYVEGYVQLNGDTARAYGIGARVSPPILGWGAYQVYGRYDLPLRDGTRVLLNPGVFLHAGHSPNGENPGHFLAFVQGVGVELRGERTTVVPALTLVAGRGDRTSYGVREGPFTAVFGAASVSVTFHRRRPAPAAP